MLVHREHVVWRIQVLNKWFGEIAGVAMVGSALRRFNIETKPHAQVKTTEEHEKFKAHTSELVSLR